MRKKSINSINIDDIEKTVMRIFEEDQKIPAKKSAKEIRDEQRDIIRQTLIEKLKPVIQSQRRKKITWKEISEFIFGLSGVKFSVRELREAVGEAPAKKSQPAPQTPSPAEQMSPQGSPAAAPRTAPASNAAQKSE